MTHSLDSELVDQILHRSMPSFQLSSADDHNLGLGYIYYGIARAMRPKKTVVIGSKAGFAPLCFARAVADNNGSRIGCVDCYDVTTIDTIGSVDFIDPSYSMESGDPHHSHGIGYWSSPSVAEKLWADFGVAHVAKHFKQTSAGYIADLPDNFEIDLLYIDGDHSYEGVLHDFLGFLPYLGRESLVLAHDVDPQCRSARGHEVLQELCPDTYSVARIPIYPGLAFMLPAGSNVRERGFAPLPMIGGYHGD